MEIRNFVLAGHGGCGKTSLGEAMLFLSGATTRLNRVDEGNSILDYDEDEIERRISINLSVATFERDGVTFNLLDTPGYLDFWGDVLSGLSVADGAVVVVDTASGVEVGTERVWQFCEERKLPRIIFLNKIRKEGVDFESGYNGVKEDLGGGVFPLTIPIGTGLEVKGVVDLLRKKAFFYSDGKVEEREIPQELQDKVEEYRGYLIEALAESDETLMEKYVEEQPITDEELISALKRGVLEGTVFPALCGDALHLIGVDVLMYYIKELLPSPKEARLPKGKKGEEEIELTPDGPFVGFVFKTLFEPHIGEMNLIRVYRGKLTSGMEVKNTTRDKSEKVNQMYMLKGKERKEVKEADTGAIVALLKLKETKTGDTLADPSDPIVLPPIKFPEPSISVAIVPKSKGDEEKVSNGLARLHEEDPTFVSSYDAEMKQTLISGLGEGHLEIIVRRLKRKFDVDVEIERPKIHYRETIKKKAEAQGKYKKQTGGRGQYGDVWIRIEPLERGKGFEFVDAIVGGVVPAKYIPAVEKGVKEAMQNGILAGYPVVDVKVTLYDGSHHPVDSSDIAFKIAGSLAFKNAAAKANVVLLEPILEVEVIVPEEFMGDVIGDLNARRGKILGMERVGKYQKIKAYVPEAEMYKYSTTLRSLTQGKGTFTQRFAFYEEVPKEIADKIVEERKKEMEEENK